MSSPPPHSPAPRAAGGSTARALTIASFVMAVLAVLFWPFVLGVLAIVLGVAAYFMGDRPLAVYAIIASVVALFGGWLLSALIYSTS
jgi:hypothetical protein